VDQDPAHPCASRALDMQGSFGSAAMRLDALEAELNQLRTQEAQFHQGFAAPSRLPPLASVSPTPTANPNLARINGPSPCATAREEREDHNPNEKAFKELLVAHRELLQTLTTQSAGQAELVKQHSELMKAHQELVKLRSVPTPPPEVRPAGSANPRIRRQKTRHFVSNDIDLQAPSEPTLLDNTLLFLPERAVRDMSLEPNMNDKSDNDKTMWSGRVWELRELMATFHRDKLAKIASDTAQLTEFRKRELKAKMKDPKVRQALRKFAARWRGAAYRNRCSFAVLDRLKYSNLRGTLIYAHGSGGCSWDNYRICRMIAGMGILVIAPDGFAYPKNTAMGQMRHKELAPLHKATDDVDYWANDLVYTSGAAGTFNYSSKAASVLQKPDEYKDIYEKCYQLRRSELHFTISHLPHWVHSQGFYLGGTSEGAMTVARFDDQRYGAMLIGRFINSFSIEYCYFTPEPEAGLIGGQLDVPTLNIIGTKDQYFGKEDSVAKLVAENGVTGYGDRNLTGNGYNTLVRQGVDVGLVCVLEDGVHSPCNTHDNFMRQIFNTFFSRTQSIWELHMIWAVDPSVRALVQLEDTTAVGEGMIGKNITRLFVPKMKYPNRMSLRQVEILRSFNSQDELRDAMAKEKCIIEAERTEIKEQLDRVRVEAAKQRNLKLTGKPASNFYAKDKLAIKCAWKDWLKMHSS